MGFALWIDQELAWLEGRHEYQPMGSAVIARTDLFRERDFRRSARRLDASLQGYAGLFASLGEVNEFLMRRRLPAEPVTPARGTSRRRQDSARRSLIITAVEPSLESGREKEPHSV